jgi:hypothetical protein
MKRIELRSNFARWYGRIAVNANKQLSSVLRGQNPDPEKVRELRKTISECLEEQRRYTLAARVCGNEVLTIR